MSPDTLRKLREWLTIEETASELSTALSDDVSASDVLRLVLDRQLQLSIYLPAKSIARCRKMDVDAPDAPWTRGTIEGVWDVPMIDKAIDESTAPSVNSDFQHEVPTHDKAQPE